MLRLVDVREIADEASFKKWMLARKGNTQQRDFYAILGRCVLRKFPNWCEFLSATKKQKFASVVTFARAAVCVQGVNKFPHDMMHAVFYAGNASSNLYRAEEELYSEKEAWSLSASAGDGSGYTEGKQVKLFQFGQNIASFVHRVGDELSRAGRSISNMDFRNLDWPSVQADCRALQAGYDIQQMPLWENGKTPENILASWEVSCAWMKDKPGYGFWIRWFEAALEGRPITGDWDSHWQFLHDILTGIRSFEWSKRAEHVAGLISEIEVKYFQKRLPLAEELTQNPETGKYRVHSIPVADIPLLDTLLARLEDLLEDCHLSHNGIGDSDRETRVIRRVLEKYRDNPQRIEMDFTDLASRLRMKLRLGEYAESDENSGLLSGVEDCIRLVRDRHPDVVANRSVLAHQKMKDMSKDESASLDIYKGPLSDASEGVLADDFLTDIPEIVMPPLPGVTRDAPVGPMPPLPGAIRTFGRAAKMLEIETKADPNWYEKISEWIRQVDNSAAYKGARIIATGGSLVGILYAIVQLGIRLFGVI